MSDNPYQAPVEVSQPVVGVLSGERADLHRVAIFQKGLIYSIAVSLLAYIGLVVLAATADGSPMSIRLIAVLMAMVLFVAGCAGTAFVFLLSVKVNGIVWGLIMGLVSLVPCLGLLALLTVNEKGTKVLRANGIKVGLFGARMSDLPAG